MPDNFEEQFLLMLVPYDKTFVHYVPPKGRPDLPSNVPVLPDPIKNADSWTQAVRNDIINISKTKVGSHLLRSIKLYGHVINIRPLDESVCNAFTSGDDIPFYTKDNLAIGTGGDILFNPFALQKGGKCSDKYVNLGGIHIESHESLLHELVHTFRKISGKLKRDPVRKGLSFYGDNEEFIAVMVQGIYASERKKPIRASHTGHFEINKELNTSLKFYKSGTETFKLVDAFCRENPGFTKGIAEIDTAFNPINAYYYDRGLVMRLSNSAMAQGRDNIIPKAERLIKFLRKEFKIF